MTKARVSRAVVIALDAAAPNSPDPLTTLAGLPLVTRCVLTLQKAGARSVALVTSPGRSDIVRAVCEDPRIRLDVLPVACSDERPLHAARALGPGPVLVAHHDVVADPALYAALAEADLDGVEALLSVDGAGARLGPLLVARLSDAAAKSTESRAIETPGWAVRVDGEDGCRGAVAALFEACRKPVDGIVSRHLNRHVSIFISKRLVNTRITPNHVSACTLALGLVAAACVAQGGYAWTLTGAALLQFDSILDGVDGELARVRFQQSRLGEWLDNVSDDVTALAFWAGLALGAAGLEQGRWLSMAGWVAVASHVLFIALSYSELLQRDSGNYFDLEWYDAADTSWRTRLMRMLVWIPRRDFFVFFCLCAAVLGALPYVLPLIAITGVSTLAAALWRTVSRSLRKTTETSVGGEVAS